MARRVVGAAPSGSTDQITKGYADLARARARLLTAAQAARGRAAADTAVHPSPPTVTTGTALADGTITKEYTLAAKPSAFTFAGGVSTAWGGGYYRFPVVTRPDASGGNAVGATDAHQFFIEVMTDGDRIAFHFQGSAAYGLVFEVDGQRIISGVTAYAGTTGNSYHTLTWTTSAIRRVRVWADRASGLLRAIVPATRTVWASAKPLRFVTMGDSVSADIGADRPDGGYSALLGTRLGWEDVRSVALGGTGFVTSANSSTFGNTARIADVVTAAPDVLLISATSNDSGVAQATLTAAVTATLTALRAVLPLAPIIVAGPFGGTGLATSTLTNIEAYTKAGFDAWADPNSFWIPTEADPSETWITGTGKVGTTNGSGNADYYVSSDGFHPSPAGHDYHARRFEAAIRKLVLPNF